MRRFTFVAGRSSKFWNIHEPRHVADQDSWIVRVDFGRIGTAGQRHVKIFGTRWGAEAYYNSKIVEKRLKGYVEQYAGDVIRRRVQEHAPAMVRRPILMGRAEELLPPSRTIPAVLGPGGRCVHDSLKKSGAGTWKCNGCGESIEFEKQIDASKVTPALAKRFIDLSELE